jgi:coenzyme F420-reducing hydrogenase gamma subunit
MEKPKVGVFGFSGCAGCQLQILNLEDVLLDVLSLIDLMNFRMASSKNTEGPFDVSFVEGSIVHEEQVEELKQIREESKILVALGTCACYGGVQSLRNFFGIDGAKKIVYADTKMDYTYTETKPISEYVKVDFSLPGCPIDKDEFVETLKSLLMGKVLKPKSYAVCVECKLRENFCLLERGEICMGPVTMGGCKATCPTNGHVCEGCRGPVEEANIASEVELLLKKISQEDLLRRFRMYTAGAKEFSEVRV